MTMWAEQNKYKTKNEELLELGLIGAICFVLGFVFFYDNDTIVEPDIDSEPSMEIFNQYPLQAWQTTDINNGDCIKVRYRVQKENTRLYMINTKGKIVHKQPISFDPYKDGRDTSLSTVVVLVLAAPPATVPAVVVSVPVASIKAWDTLAPIWKLPANAAVLVSIIDVKTVIISFFIVYTFFFKLTFTIVMRTY